MIILSLVNQFDEHYGRDVSEDDFTAITMLARVVFYVILCRYYDSRRFKVTNPTLLTGSGKVNYHWCERKTLIHSLKLIIRV